MANVILPVAWWSTITLGGWLNMLNYDEYSSQPPIFNDSDIIELEYLQPILDARYYVLQEDTLPYSAMRLPVDLLLRIQSRRYPKTISYDIPREVISNHKPIHKAALVLVTEFTTGAQILNNNAAPVTGWQDFVSKTATHYVEEVTFGVRCVSVLEVNSYAGNDQIIRKILTEIMGTSGSFTNKDIPAFTELWKYAKGALRESPDVRDGANFRRRVPHILECTAPSYLEVPSKATHDFENFLEYLQDIPQHLQEKQASGEKVLLSASFKLLHNLDDRYPPMEINKESEEYLTLLHEKMEDCQRVVMNGYLIPRSQEIKNIKENFWSKVGELWSSLYDLSATELSIYNTTDVEEIDELFKQYEAGLDKGDINYYSAWKKLSEHIERSCKRLFYLPTSGVLNATEDEVEYIQLLKEGLEECKEHCYKEERCRAIGYDEANPTTCRIYSVSTVTATISSEEDNSMKIYDRVCEVRAQ